MNTFESPLIIDERVYSLAVLRRAIYKNLAQAAFLIRINTEGRFELDILKKKSDFQISSFLDDLNHYNFLESENRHAEPILNSILTKLQNEPCCLTPS